MSSIEKQLEEEIAQLESKLLGNHSPDDGESTKETVQPVEELNSDVPITNDPIVEPEEVAKTTQEEEEEVQKKERNDWKKRYKNYKASTDATLHSLRKEVITLTESNTLLSNENDKLRSEVTSLRQNSADDIYKDLFSEEEKDIVGEDTISTMKKATRAAVDAAVKPLQEALEEERRLRQKVSQDHANDLSKTIQETFLDKLEELSPDYSKYDTDPAFHKWMNEPDEISGVIRTILFKNAQSIGDAERVAGFFNRYAKMVETKTAVLDQNISPSKSTAAQPTKQVQKELTITRAFIDKFYEDCIRGRYRGKEKLRQEIESKIDLAIANNEIR